MDRCFYGLGAFMEPASGSKACDPNDHACTGACRQSIDQHPKTSATSGEDNNPFTAILSLDPFERSVFVMSTLEGQSDAECAVLLRCSQRDVMMARVLAVKRQSSADALVGTILQS